MGGLGASSPCAVRQPSSKGEPEHSRAAQLVAMPTHRSSPSSASFLSSSYPSGPPSSSPTLLLPLNATRNRAWLAPWTRAGTTTLTGYQIWAVEQRCVHSPLDKGRSELIVVIGRQGHGPGCSPASHRRAYWRQERLGKARILGLLRPAAGVGSGARLGDRRRRWEGTGAAAGRVRTRL